MQILQINASYKPAFIYGGPTMSVSKLSEELAKAGLTVEVLTTTANGTEELDVQSGEKLLVDGVSVTYFRRFTKGNSHFSPALLIFLWKTLKNSKTTKVVHIHAWWNLVSVGSCLIASIRSKIIIISPRGTLSHYSFGNRKSFLKNIFHNIIGKTLLERCHFHVTSEKEKKDILKIINPLSITVISNFVNLGPATFDVRPFKNTRIKNTRKLRLLFLSRIEEKKGLDILFKGLKKLKLPFHLIIAGSGQPDYILLLKSLAKDLNIASEISWVGQQNREQKFSLLAENDLLVLPSHDENFANVVIESLSVGTPVLISKMVGLSDYVRTNDLGWISDNTPDDLKNMLTEASRELGKRQHIRLTAPTKIAIDFNDQNLLNQYLKFYQNILGHA